MQWVGICHPQLMQGRIKLLMLDKSIELKPTASSDVSKNYMVAISRHCKYKWQQFIIEALKSTTFTPQKQHAGGCKVQNNGLFTA